MEGLHMVLLVLNASRKAKSLEMLHHPLGDNDGGEVRTPIKSLIPYMRQGSGQGDGSEIIAKHKS